MQRLFDTALSEPRESHVCANGALRLVLRMSRLGVLCLPVAGGGSRSMCTPVARSVTFIETRQTIDAQCRECDIIWPVNADERAAILSAIAGSQTGTQLPSRITSDYNNSFPDRL